MQSSNLASLLKLPADERAELAMALWESPTDQERESEPELSPPAIPWGQVRRKLRDVR